MKYKSLSTFCTVVKRSLGVLFALFVGLNLSPIYDFAETEPFSGEQIYNPYADYDSIVGWHRANLHTHTHAKAWINECELYADSILKLYKGYDYDIVTFSNHMELTEYPEDKDLQVDVYEHGYNITKLHNLVFNPVGIDYRDILLPVLPSQMQYKMDRLLDRGADFIFLNHPDRTRFVDDDAMRKLTAYRLLEADCGFDEADTYGHKWDVALSSGHYVLSAIGDDLHKPHKSNRIARRCCMFNLERGTYPELKSALLSGNFYTVHLPDFGDGNLVVKHNAVKHLPRVVGLGLNAAGAPYIALSDTAHLITAIGQNGRILCQVQGCSSLSYPFQASDTYVRFVARFADGVVISSNPFARWSGATSSGTPYVEVLHPIDWPFTLLFNGTLMALTVLVLWFTNFRRGRGCRLHA